VADGVPQLAPGAGSDAAEAVVHLVYQLFAPFHDFGVRYCLPWLQFATEDETRRGLLAPLELAAIGREARVDRPVRILDVGIGTGGNLPYLEFLLPDGLDVEIWGLDFSSAMLARCRDRLRDWEGPPVHLLLGDAHALPFPDGFFDRVLHVGGINAYADRRRALAEMARVARPGTPIVVGDEQLDERAARSWYQWLGFHWITAFDRVRHAPVEAVPAGAQDLRVTQASSFFYAMSFRMPARA
jgi:ubiquinone/menaquinone biosynthesis C-methylase UbiE